MSLDLLSIPPATTPWDDPASYWGRMTRALVGVWFRHARSGELAGHVDRDHLVDGTGQSLVGTVATYRGEGKASL